MKNIWNYFDKDGRTYWCNKTNTLKFWQEAQKGSRFIIFDLETTGLKKKADVVVEFSALVAEKINGFYTFVDSVEYYIRPVFKMTPEVIAVHGITNEFLEDKPTEEEIFPEIKAFFDKYKDAVITGYNVGFDIKFMEEMYKRQKLTFAPENVVDVFAMVKENIFFDEHEGNRRLSEILPVLFPGKSYKFHDSSDDIKATWDVGVGIIKRYFESGMVPENAKYPGKLISYQYWSVGKTQRLYCTIEMCGNYYDIYYDIYQSCWACEPNKNGGYNIFLYVNMDSIEEQFTAVAKLKGKEKFRLLRDNDNYRHWSTMAG